MDIVVGLLLGWSIIFATNSEFFNTVEELKQQGHEWEYTGKQFWNNNPNVDAFTSGILLFNNCQKFSYKRSL